MSNFKFDWGKATYATATEMSERDYLYRGEETYTYKHSITSELAINAYINDFKHQHNPKDVEEPQTIFHFDPKGIVEEWPEKEI